MIYIAYKTYSLRKELLNQGIKIDDFQAYIKNSKGNNLYFEQLLLIYKDMYNSKFHYEIDNVFKTADLNGEEIKLILVSDFNDTVGKWQGIELMIAAKYKAEIYLVNNSIFVSQMLNGMNNNKIIVKALNFREYKRIR